MKKKIISLLLSLSLLTGLLIGGTLATTASGPSFGFTAASTATADRGGTVNVVLTFVNNPGLTNTSLQIDFDPDFLIFTSDDYIDLEMPAMMTGSQGYRTGEINRRELTTGRLIIGIESSGATENYTGSVLPALKFTVKSDAPETSTKVSVSTYGGAAGIVGGVVTSFAIASAEHTININDTPGCNSSSDCVVSAASRVDTPATCTTAGRLFEECENCFRIINDIERTALGHTMGSWEVTAPAAIGAEGVETRVCSVCDVEEARSIAALPAPPSVPEEDDDRGEDTVPGDTPPGDTTPGDTTPGDTTIDIETPGDTTIDIETPDDTTPDDTIPDIETPGDEAPDIIVPPAPVIEFAPEDFIDETVIEDILQQEAPPVIYIADIRAEDGGTVISANMLRAIAEGGRDIEVVLDNGFSFIIVADSIQDGAAPFDLNVVIEFTDRATTIAVTGTGAAAGATVRVPANAVVIMPNATGDFGFDIVFSFTAAELAAAGINGNNVKLWYVDHYGVVTDSDKLRRNADGSVEFTISSASYYVLSEDAPIGVIPAELDVNVKTGVTVGFTAVIVSGAALLLSRKRK
jgi:hypothetical protein